MKNDNMKYILIGFLTLFFTYITLVEILKDVTIFE